MENSESSGSSRRHDDIIRVFHRYYEKGKLVSAPFQWNQMTRDKPRAPNPFPVPPLNIPKIQEEESLPQGYRRSIFPPDAKNDVEPESMDTLLQNLDKKSEVEIREITRILKDSAKFKVDYPFLVEGIIQRDPHRKGYLKVYTSRIGQIQIPDRRRIEEMDTDYVYFVVVRDAVFRGFLFTTHPSHLISINLPIVNAYGILAASEDSSFVWNESLGLMHIDKPIQWDQPLEIISFHASYQNDHFMISRINRLKTDQKRKDHFASGVMIVNDSIFLEEKGDDLELFSPSINAIILVKKDLVSRIQDFEDGIVELIVIPTFPESRILEYRAIQLIKFWSVDNDWIRQELIRRSPIL